MSDEAGKSDLGDTFEEDHASPPALGLEISCDQFLPWKTELRLLLTIAWPIVASMLAQTLLSIVDYAIVSTLGSQAQAAVSSAGMVFFSIFAFLLGTMACMTTVVSQSLGARRLADCSAYAWQGIWASLLFGTLGLLVWPIVPFLYDLIGHDLAVRKMEVGYTRIRLLCIGVAGASVALGNFFNGIHRPTQNTITAVGANIINGVLSYGLVLGKWGLPAMGVEGAAWGSVVATVVRMLWLLAAMCYGRRTRPFNASRTWRFDRDKMRRLIRVGWPSGLNFVMDIAAWSVFLLVIIGRFGTIELAATATCCRFAELSFMPAVGIGIAVSALVGRSIGQGRPDLARRRAGLGTLINAIYMVLMGTIFVTFGSGLMRLFSDNLEVIRLGAQLLVLIALFQLFDAVAITYSNALRGAGDTRWPAVVTPIQAWSIMVGGGFWISYAWPELGSKGPWIFAAAYVIIVGITLWVRWHRGKWEGLDVIGRKEARAEAIPSEPVVNGIDLRPDIAQQYE